MAESEVCPVCGAPMKDGRAGCTACGVGRPEEALKLGPPSPRTLVWYGLHALAGGLAGWAFSAALDDNPAHFPNPAGIHALQTFLNALWAGLGVVVGLTIAKRGRD